MSDYQMVFLDVYWHQKGAKSQGAVVKRETQHNPASIRCQMHNLYGFWVQAPMSLRKEGTEMES